MSGVFRTRLRLKQPKFSIVGDTLTPEGVLGMTPKRIVEMVDRVKTWSDNNEIKAFGYCVVRANGYAHYASYSTSGHKHALVANVLYLLDEVVSPPGEDD